MMVFFSLPENHPILNGLVQRGPINTDQTVPYPENTAILKARYEALGGSIQVILKPGCDHHPHSLTNPQPIVDFVLKNN